MDRENISIRLRGYICAIIVGLICAACTAQPTLTLRVEPTIAVLLTEQAQLGTQIAAYDQDGSTPMPVIASPSPTPKPSVTPTLLETLEPDGKFLLPQAIYFLSLDENLHQQIFRLDPDGVNIIQISSFGNEQEVSDFDVFKTGDLVYALNHNDNEKPPLLVWVSSKDKTENIIYESDSKTSTTGELVKTRILHPRWSSDGESIFFTREVLYPDQVSIYTELIQYRVQSNTQQVILSDQDGIKNPVTASVYTNEALEYISGVQWNKEYKVVQTTPDDRFILIEDTTSNLWSVYDLKTRSVKEAFVFGQTGALLPDGNSLFLGGMAAPVEQPISQTLTRIDFSASSTFTYLSFPDWDPLGLSFNEDLTSIYFFQFDRVDNVIQVQFFQLELNVPDKKPVLIREEILPFTLVPDSALLASPSPLGWVFYGPISEGSGESQNGAIAIIMLDKSMPVVLYENINVVNEIHWGP